MALTPDTGTRNTYALALLRIGVGILFLIFAQYKVFGTAFTLRRLSILDQQIPRRRRLPVHGAHPPRLCPSARHDHRLPGSLRRIGDRARTHFRRPGAFRQLRRPDPHADHAFLFGLSRRGRALLAILWRQPEPLGICAVLRRVFVRARRLHLVSRSAAKESSECQQGQKSMSRRL